MAAVKLLPAALRDLERLVAFLRDEHPAAAAATASLIFEGIAVLRTHPLIGRPIDAERRELIVFRGRTGYVAQYQFDAAADEVLVLAVRHQRELEP